MQQSVLDFARGKDSVAIRVFQSAGLIDHVRTLRKLALDSTKQDEIVCLTTASILMAAAAVEALLSESASILKPKLYANIKFCRAGAPEKYEMMVGLESKDVKDLWSARKTIGHSEPDSQRSREVGAVLNSTDVGWVYEVVRKIAREIWTERQCLIGFSKRYVRFNARSWPKSDCTTPTRNWPKRVETEMLSCGKSEINCCLY